jgi:hypothetical protein
MPRVQGALLEEAGEVGARMALEFRRGRQQEHHAEIHPKQHQRAPREDALDDLSWKPHGERSSGAGSSDLTDSD